jgi:alkanesulfonate monooxygenase SsuD/methylene tetrahydromethanopterin reductase-like flavin-dependent oxidoreductase (luciferase family)
VGAAVTPPTAAWVAEWADALITVSQADEQLDAVVEAFRSNGGEGKPMLLQAHLAWAPNESEARDAAFAQWRQNTLPSSVMTELAHPAQISDAAAHVGPDALDGAVRLSSDLSRHVEWLRRDLERGFEAIYLHEVGPDQERFIEAFGREVLPAVKEASPG